MQLLGKPPILIARKIFAKVYWGGRSASRRRREALASRWLRGDGIEIGALNYPLRMQSSCRVTYVDRLHVEELSRHYPELARESLVDVELIDDGECLSTFPQDSQDFVIANHFLEHCENPIGALGSWLRVLRPGGLAYFAVPDKRLTFDYRRPPTPWEHFLRDLHEGPSWSREGHYREWLEFANDTPPSEVAVRVQAFMESCYSIHFHVWTPRTLRDFLGRCQGEIGLPFTLSDFVRNGAETICVLRKQRSQSLGQVEAERSTLST